MMEYNKGFTFVEVVITILLVSILSIAGTAVYRRHLNNAKYNEGLQLLQSVKEQEDLALSFASDENVNPFFYTATVTGTYEVNRDSQNLGKFYIYPQNYKYFNSFKIRAPEGDEPSKYGVVGHGYVIEAFYPQELGYQLRLRLIGSSEGPYNIVRD